MIILPPRMLSNHPAAHTPLACLIAHHTACEQPQIPRTTQAVSHDIHATLLALGPSLHGADSRRLLPEGAATSVKVVHTPLSIYIANSNC
jgi:hypothetical protein